MFSSSANNSISSPVNTHVEGCDTGTARESAGGAAAAAGAAAALQHQDREEQAGNVFTADFPRCREEVSSMTVFGTDSQDATDLNCTAKPSLIPVSPPSMTPNHPSLVTQPQLPTPTPTLTAMAGSPPSPPYRLPPPQPPLPPPPLQRVLPSVDAELREMLRGMQERIRVLEEHQARAAAPPTRHDAAVQSVPVGSLEASSPATGRDAHEAPQDTRDATPTRTATSTTAPAAESASTAMSEQRTASWTRLSRRMTSGLTREGSGNEHGDAAGGSGSPAVPATPVTNTAVSFSAASAAAAPSVHVPSTASAGPESLSQQRQRRTRPPRNPHVISASVVAEVHSAFIAERTAPPRGCASGSGGGGGSSAEGVTAHAAYHPSTSATANVLSPSDIANSKWKEASGASAGSGLGSSGASGGAATAAGSIGGGGVQPLLHHHSGTGAPAGTPMPTTSAANSLSGNDPSSFSVSRFAASHGAGSVGGGGGAQTSGGGGGRQRQGSLVTVLSPTHAAQAQQHQKPPPQQQQQGVDGATDTENTTTASAAHTGTTSSDTASTMLMQGFGWTIPVTLLSSPEVSRSSTPVTTQSLVDAAPRGGALAPSSATPPLHRGTHPQPQPQHPQPHYPPSSTSSSAPHRDSGSRMHRGPSVTAGLRPPLDSLTARAQATAPSHRNSGGGGGVEEREAGSNPRTGGGGGGSSGGGASDDDLHRLFEALCLPHARPSFSAPSLAGATPLSTVGTGGAAAEGGLNSFASAVPVGHGAGAAAGASGSFAPSTSASMSSWATPPRRVQLPAGTDSGTAISELFVQTVQNTMALTQLREFLAAAVRNLHEERDKRRRMLRRVGTAVETLFHRTSHTSSALARALRTLRELTADVAKGRATYRRSGSRTSSGDGENDEAENEDGGDGDDDGDEEADTSERSCPSFSTASVTFSHRQHGRSRRSAGGDSSGGGGSLSQRQSDRRRRHRSSGRNASPSTVTGYATLSAPFQSSASLLGEAAARITPAGRRSPSLISHFVPATATESLPLGAAGPTTIVPPTATPTGTASSLRGRPSPGPHSASAKTVSNNSSLQSLASVNPAHILNVHTAGHTGATAAAAAAATANILLSPTATLTSPLTVTSSTPASATPVPPSIIVSPSVVVARNVPIRTGAATLAALGSLSDAAAGVGSASTSQHGSGSPFAPALSTTDARMGMPLPLNPSSISDVMAPETPATGNATAARPEAVAAVPAVEHGAVTAASASAAAATTQARTRSDGAVQPAASTAPGRPSSSTSLNVSGGGGGIASVGGMGSHNEHSNNNSMNASAGSARRLIDVLRNEQRRSLEAERPLMNVSADATAGRETDRTHTSISRGSSSGGRGNLAEGCHSAGQGATFQVPASPRGALAGSLANLLRHSAYAPHSPGAAAPSSAARSPAARPQAYRKGSATPLASAPRSGGAAGAASSSGQRRQSLQAKITPVVLRARSTGSFSPLKRRSSRLPSKARSSHAPGAAGPAGAEAVPTPAHRTRSVTAGTASQSNINTNSGNCAYPPSGAVLPGVSGVLSPYHPATRTARARALTLLSPKKLNAAGAAASAAASSPPPLPLPQHTTAASTSRERKSASRQETDHFGSVSSLRHSPPQRVGTAVGNDERGQLLSPTRSVTSNSITGELNSANALRQRAGAGTSGSGSTVLSPSQRLSATSAAAAATATVAPPPPLGISPGAAAHALALAHHNASHHQPSTSSSGGSGGAASPLTAALVTGTHVNDLSFSAPSQRFQPMQPPLPSALSSILQHQQLLSQSQHPPQQEQMTSSQPSSSAPLPLQGRQLTSLLSLTQHQGSTSTMAAQPLPLPAVPALGSGAQPAAGVAPPGSAGLAHVAPILLSHTVAPTGAAAGQAGGGSVPRSNPLRRVSPPRLPQQHAPAASDRDEHPLSRAAAVHPQAGNKASPVRGSAPSPRKMSVAVRPAQALATQHHQQQQPHASAGTTPQPSVSPHVPAGASAALPPSRARTTGNATGTRAATDSPWGQQRNPPLDVSGQLDALLQPQPQPRPRSKRGGSSSSANRRVRAGPPPPLSVATLSDASESALQTASTTITGSELRLEAGARADHPTPAAGELGGSDSGVLVGSDAADVLGGSGSGSALVAPTGSDESVKGAGAVMRRGRGGGGTAGVAATASGVPRALDALVPLFAVADAGENRSHSAHPGPPQLAPELIAERELERSDVWPHQRYAQDVMSGSDGGPRPPPMQHQTTRQRRATHPVPSPHHFMVVMPATTASSPTSPHAASATDAGRSAERSDSGASRETGSDADEEAHREHDKLGDAQPQQPPLATTRVQSSFLFDASTPVSMLSGSLHRRRKPAQRTPPQSAPGVVHHQRRHHPQHELASPTRHGGNTEEVASAALPLPGVTSPASSSPSPPASACTAQMPCDEESQ